MAKMENLPNTKLEAKSRFPVTVIKSGVEGEQDKFTGTDSIGSNSRAQGNKSAGHVGASNVNSA